VAYRLAITIAGAVSLGSYEAGVLYEVIDAIGQHNSNANTPEDQKIFIDVLTGASAGGMSATVLAQKLLYEADALADAYDNALYRAWVEDVDISGLLKLEADEDPANSIFSSNLVESISEKLLLQRYSTHVPLKVKRHAASADQLELGLALSNLNGVDYCFPVRPDGTFNYTQFQDQLHASIDAGAQCDREEFWEPLRSAAVSCGAFPFAFRAQDLVRHRTEYPPQNVVFPAPLETFTYTDGGVFQNEPLGMAKNLVDGIDHHENNDSRFYLFIAPHAKGSSEYKEFSARGANFKAMISRLVGAVYGQAEFQDWAEAESVNERIKLFNTRALQLKELLSDGTIEIAALKATTQVLLPLFFKNPGKDEETEGRAQARLKQQFSFEYKQLSQAVDQATADGWIDAILTFETAADLGQRDEMVIYGITAEAQELAGAQLEAFVGFFQQAYRDHDYDVGRRKAQEFLKHACLGTEGNLPKIQYQPKDVHTIDKALDGLTLDGVPSDLRQTIKSRLRERANELLKEADVPWPFREGIELGIIEPQLKKLLRL